MVFPVAMYGCESWTIKKPECRRIDAFWTVVLEKTLESPLDCKEIQPVHPKGNQPWIFIGRTEAEAPILWPPDVKSWHWKRPWCWEKLRARGEGDDRGWDGWMAVSMDTSVNKLKEIVMDREAWHAAVHGVPKSQTWMSDWTELWPFLPPRMPWAHSSQNALARTGNEFLTSVGNWNLISSQSLLGASLQVQGYWFFHVFSMLCSTTPN